MGQWDKHLINQASDAPSIFFFHNFLQNSLQKFFQFIFFFYNFTYKIVLSALSNFDQTKKLGSWPKTSLGPSQQPTVLFFNPSK